MNQRLAMHETLELHELIGHKNICAKKAQAMATLVSDPQLRQFLQQEVQMSSRHAQEISQLLSSGIGGRY
ncbi:MAG: hypothetical protein GX060_00420 [Firmicutes bacterium]|nr:hypothetical protein [Bacillota bacterium]